MKNQGFQQILIRWQNFARKNYKKDCTILSSSFVIHTVSRHVETWAGIVLLLQIKLQRVRVPSRVLSTSRVFKASY